MATENLKLLERLKKLEGQLDRLAGDFFISCSFTGATLWRPPTDVYETDGEVVVRLEAPGLRAEDISIALNTDTLVIRAVRHELQHDAKTVYHQLEIHNGYFERVVALPRYIRHEGAEASYSEGFLVVRIPKGEEAVAVTRVVRLRL